MEPRLSKHLVSAAYDYPLCRQRSASACLHVICRVHVLFDDKGEKIKRRAAYFVITVRNRCGGRRTHEVRVSMEITVILSQGAAHTCVRVYVCDNKRLRHIGWFEGGGGASMIHAICCRTKSKKKLRHWCRYTTGEESMLSQNVKDIGSIGPVLNKA